MKKFLSLVLALIMVMSLVTVSAGATEYKDFTDKGEIQYEEAVAVLNRLGIITGYSEGDFRPEGELTRGAAAKIIVSLLIGPEAAEALPTTSSPYPDVPAGNVFAGYISFCKTEEIINGYNDGTFRPTGTLTGFAFAKMLLSALGYDGNIEGFTGSGWTVRVSALGSKANLFNHLDFKGGETVNRETACQLALNTLKATMVQYNGGMNITTSDGSTMVVNPERTYVTSNQQYAKNINNRKASDVGNSSSDQHYTVEFGEEHFKDLRMDREEKNSDQFGRPSNVWSYKKVTIGTYPVDADFTFTTQVIHAVDGTTDAAKVRALGLSGYETEADTNSSVRGQTTTLWLNGYKTALPSNKVAEIADYTDNGTLVEVYVSDEDADFITDVVVVKTQLMEVKRVGSDYVSLDKHGVDGKDDSKAGDPVYGYNQRPIDRPVHDVEVDDDYYELLKGLKAGDLVAVVPVTEDNVDFEVAKAYVPETVNGALTRVETYGTASEGRNAINVTVGGTKYNIAVWNKDLYTIDGDTIRVTNKDVTLYLDEYGNALKAKDVGDTSNWMVVKNYTQGLVNGNIVTYVNGWDIGGETLSLNIGSGTSAREIETTFLPGDLVYYSNNTNSNIAEWKLSNRNEDGVFFVNNGKAANGKDDYSIKSSNTTIKLDGFSETAKLASKDDRATIDTGIKFIYVNIDPTDKEVDSIEFVNGVKNATADELKGVNSFYYKDGYYDHARAQACVSLKTNNDIVTGDSAVKAVVIKRESTDASASNLLYISNYHGSATLYDNDRRPVYGYEAVIMGAGNKVVDEDAVVYSYRNLKIGQFARYTKITAPEGVEEINDNFYELRGYGVEHASDTYKRSAAITATGLYKCEGADKYLVRTTGEYGDLTAARAALEPQIAKTWEVDDYVLDYGDSKADDLLNFRGADWVDLRQDVKTRNGVTRIEDIDDLKDYLDYESNKDKVQVKVSLLFNDNPDSDEFRRVYLVVITGVAAYTGPTDPVDPQPTTGDVRFASTLPSGLKDGQFGTVTGKVNVRADGKATANIELTAPAWAYTTDGAANHVSGTSGYGHSAYVFVDYQVLRKGDDTAWGSGTIEGWNASSKKAGTVLLGNDNGTTDASVYSINGLDLNSIIAPEYAKDQELTIEITGVRWRFVKVEKYVNGVSTSLTSSEKKCLSIEETMNAVSFPIEISGTGTADYTITGVKGLVKPTGTFSAGAGYQTAGDSTKKISAEGDKAIKIEITPSAGLVQEYTVTAKDSLGSGGVALAGKFEVASSGVLAPETGKLTLTCPTDPVKKGGSANVTFTLNKIADPGVAAYKVFVTIRGEEKPVTLSYDKLTDAILITDITEDIEITEDDIRIEVVQKAQITGGEVKEDGKTLVFTFDQPLAGAGTTKTTESGNRKSTQTISDDGKTVTILFEGFTSLPVTHIYSWIKDGEKGGWWNADGTPVVDTKIRVTDGKVEVIPCDEITHTKPVVSPSTPQNP